MKLNRLKEIITDFNKKTLNELLNPEAIENKQIVNPNLKPLPKEGEASVKIPPIEFPHCCAGRCFCGKTSKGYTSPKSFKETFLTLKLSNTPEQSVAVGAVIDDDDASSDEDCSIVLAVGINYTQGDVYATQAIPLVDKTDMRPRLNKAFEHLRENDCQVNITNGKFHLVAANFFPWITKERWSTYEFNSIEEAAFFHCCGHSSPVDYIVNLILNTPPDLKADLKAVVFHGSKNAVPYLGTAVAKTLDSDVEVIFTDNLGSSPWAIQNAIKLGKCPLSRANLSNVDFDE